MLDHARLKEVLSYDPETGFFTRLVSGGGVIAGSVVGDRANHAGGYVQVSVDDKGYLAHRLAVFYMTGKWPKVKTDHWNRKRSDNRWVNLRLASSQQNCANRSKGASYRGKPMSSRHKGVTWDKRNNKWMAKITFHRKTINLGRFDNEMAAAGAYIVKAIELFEDFAAHEAREHGGPPPGLAPQPGP